MSFLNPKSPANGIAGVLERCRAGTWQDVLWEQCGGHLYRLHELQEREGNLMHPLGKTKEKDLPGNGRFVSPQPGGTYCNCTEGAVAVFRYISGSLGCFAKQTRKF